MRDFCCPRSCQRHGQSRPAIFRMPVSHPVSARILSLLSRCRVLRRLTAVFRPLIENLPVRSMTASARGTVEDPGRNVAAKAGLNTAILDKRWGFFRIRLDQKLAARGGVLIVVPAAFTSQTCASCGHVDAESRVMRDRFCCTACGQEAHADHNAACNIRGRGLAFLGLAPSGANQMPRGRDGRGSPQSPLLQTRR